MDLNRKLKRKKERKKRSRKDLRRWAEGDLLQSHRLFPAVMFNYFQSLGTWGFGGKYKQKFSFNTFLFIIWIKHLAHLSSKELKRKRFAGVLMKKRVSPLKDLNMTTGTTKCDCKNPIFLLFFFWETEVKKTKKWVQRERRREVRKVSRSRQRQHTKGGRSLGKRTNTDKLLNRWESRNRNT